MGMTERLHFSLSRIGERNGNPLQCSCLESPIDRGAWWAAIHGVAQSRTRLKRLRSSSQYSGLENFIGCIVHGVTESDRTDRLSLSLSPFYRWNPGEVQCLAQGHRILNEEPGLESKPSDCRSYRRLPLSRGGPRLGPVGSVTGRWVSAGIIFLVRICSLPVKQQVRVSSPVLEYSSKDPAGAGRLSEVPSRLITRFPWECTCGTALQGRLSSWAVLGGGVEWSSVCACRGAGLCGWEPPPGEPLCLEGSPEWPQNH